MNDATELRATEDRIAALCGATDFVRGAITQAPISGDLPEAQAEVDALERLRETALSAARDDYLTLDEMEQVRAHQALQAYREYLLDEGEVGQAGEVEEVRREVAEGLDEIPEGW